MAIRYSIEDGLSVDEFTDVLRRSGLAVDAAYQGRGIGRELLNRSHEAAGGKADVTLLLLAAPAAASHDPKAGLTKLENCRGIRREGA